MDDDSSYDRSYDSSYDSNYDSKNTSRYDSYYNHDYNSNYSNNINSNNNKKQDNNKNANNSSSGNTANGRGETEQHSCIQIPLWIRRTGMGGGRKCHITPIFQMSSSSGRHILHALIWRWLHGACMPDDMEVATRGVCMTDG